MLNDKDYRDILLEYLEATPAGILSFDAAGTITGCNNNFIAILRHYSISYSSKSELVESGLAALLGNVLSEKETNFILSGGLFEKEIRRIDAPNSSISLVLKSAPIKHGSEFRGGMLLVQDIKILSGHAGQGIREEKSPAALPLPDIDAEQKDLYAEMTELKDLGNITSAVVKTVIAADENGRIVFWNRNAESLFGRRRSEVFGQNISRVIPELNTDYFSSVKSEISAAGQWSGEMLIPAYKKRGPVRLNINAAGTEISAGAIYVFHCTDITEKTEAEKLLKLSEEIFRSIVYSISHAICITDESGKIRFANPAFCRLTGFNSEELKDTFLSDYLDEQYRLEDFSRECEIQGVTVAGPDGQTVCLNMRIIPTGAYSERNVIVSMTDTTAQCEAEKRLSVINLVTENIEDGILILENGIVSFANSVMHRINAAASGFETDRPADFGFLIDDDIRLLHENIDTVAKEPGGIKTFQCRTTGSEDNAGGLYLRCTAGCYSIQGSSYCFLIFHDITENILHERAMQESEERYKKLVEDTDAFFWAAEFSYGSINPSIYSPSIEKITGYDQSAYRSDSRLWLKIIHPDDLPELKKQLRTLMHDKARFSNDVEFRIIHRSGSIIWIKNVINVKRDAAGKVTGFYGTASNITDVRKSEEELKNSAAALKALNDTKDKFISIISHDLRTPFSSVIGFTDILLSEKDLPEEQRNQYIGFINESSKNMLTMVNSLLDWTRLQTGRIKFEPARMNMNKVARKALNINSGAAIQKGIELDLELTGEVFVHADEDLMLQVLNNLISNAVKFTKRGGSVTLRAVPNIDLNVVEFILADTGTGIRQEDLGKLFKIDSKFTLDGTSGEKGSGLGLSLVQDIISKHGGTIRVESEYGHGTQFIFTLPVSSTSILLVDSNVTERLLYTKILKNLLPAYKVECCGTGEEAYEIIADRPPALVITEHYLPGGSGYDLVKQIRTSELKSRPPFIVLSRDINRHISEEYQEQGVEYIFRKPVNLSKFKEAVTNSLRKALYK